MKETSYYPNHACSITSVVYRQFLPSVCDDCIVREQLGVNDTCLGVVDLKRRSSWLTLSHAPWTTNLALATSDDLSSTSSKLRGRHSPDWTLTEDIDSHRRALDISREDTEVAAWGNQSGEEREPQLIKSLSEVGNTMDYSLRGLWKKQRYTKSTLDDKTKRERWRNSIRSALSRRSMLFREPDSPGYVVHQENHSSSQPATARNPSSDIVVRTQDRTSRESQTSNDYSTRSMIRTSRPMYIHDTHDNLGGPLTSMGWQQHLSDDLGRRPGCTARRSRLMYVLQEDFK